MLIHMLYYLQSTYKEQFEKDKDKNRFDITDTDRFKAGKEANKMLSDVRPSLFCLVVIASELCNVFSSCKNRNSARVHQNTNYDILEKSLTLLLVLQRRAVVKLTFNFFCT